MKFISLTAASILEIGAASKFKNMISPNRRKKTRKKTKAESSIGSNNVIITNAVVNIYMTMPANSQG